jgi:hypothetical protein
MMNTCPLRLAPMVFAARRYSTLLSRWYARAMSLANSSTIYFTVKSHDRKHFQQSLQAFARRKPFKPFTVELVSGDRFVVDHPEALAQREAVAVYIDREGRYTLFDSSSVSQLTEIVDRATA